MEISQEKEYEDLTFRGLKKIDENIRDKTFINCEFNNCDFTQTDFSNSKFEDCIFNECNLTLVKYDDVKLRNAKFKGCKLVGVNFNKCDTFILEIGFQDSLIENCNFSSLALKKSLFKNSNILESDFVGTDLSECDFTSSSLGGTIFDNSNLSKANFSDAKDYDINPLNNIVKKAVFTMPEAMMLLRHFNITIK
ncbi:MAG: pentapeptide repeat-containing protein [Clostridium lundense]|nr:pentapeptide repeat-containing protein [Clostridium lundense]